jgi:DNA polymerase (family 10)
MSNKEQLIKMFSDLSLYEESQKRTFPAKAYIKAIASLKNLHRDVEKIEDVQNLPGFGKGLFEKVESYLKTGTFKRYEEFKNSDFAKLIELSKIKGIGANKVQELAKAGIYTIEELKAIVKDLKVGDMIPGSSIKYIQAIKVGLEFEAHTEKTRMTVQEHDAIAIPIINDLKLKFNNIEASFAGSRRRWNGINMGYTIGDIDIIIGVPESELKDFYKNLISYLDEVVMEGSKKVSGVKNARQIDFRIVALENFESLLLHATGPMEWNIGLRKIAISKNEILNEYGLFDRDTKEVIAKSEEMIMMHLLGKVITPDERKLYKFTF